MLKFEMTAVRIIALPLRILSRNKTSQNMTCTVLELVPVERNQLETRPSHKFLSYMSPRQPPEQNIS